MQPYSTTADLKRYHPPCPEDSHDEEGFAVEETESLIVPKHETHDDMQVPKDGRRKPRVLYREPKLKLTFISKQKNTKDELRKSIMYKESRSHQARSLQVTKKESKKSLHMDLLSECVSKIKRTVVGDNIAIPSFSFNDSKALKNCIVASGAALIYEQNKEINTHGFIRNMNELSSTFLESEANQLLRTKLRDSFIMPKKVNRANLIKSIDFQGEYQNANLQFVSQVAEDQYECYLKNDTNTHGHQSWFLFKITNSTEDVKRITVHICNLKRYLPMYSEGSRVYLRKVLANSEAETEWLQGGENVQFRVNNNQKISNARLYKLSFDVAIEKESTVEVALLPAYTYSDLLKDIQGIRECPNLSVDTLTYSLVGLAIPLLTFTRGNYHHKQVILINCRVHPGQANSSYMCRGLMRWLAGDSPSIFQFLERHIVKIVPMLNPDGVILGNFRTNFLGVDLNRCFDSQDQITNPQVFALKQLGRQLREEHGERFNLFLDLHGHSSQKNIFSYGPDFQSTDTNFYQIRLFPKVLNLRSKMFKYWSCTFKLEQYKRYTARGYFLNEVGALAYTIEAGYGFYQDEGKLVSFGTHQWTQFGCTIAEGLTILAKLSKLSLLRNKNQIKKAISDADRQQLEIIKKFKREFKKEKEEPVAKRESKKEKGAEDSDGEGDAEDYTRAEKEEVMRRVSETMAPNMILPRVLKPSIVYPTVTPKLFKYREDSQNSQLKILYTKRVSRYSGLRMPGNSYIQNFRGIEMIKPETKQLL